MSTRKVAAHGSVVTNGTAAAFRAVIRQSGAQVKALERVASKLDRMTDAMVVKGREDSDRTAAAVDSLKEHLNVQATGLAADVEREGIATRVELKDRTYEIKQHHSATFRVTRRLALMAIAVATAAGVAGAATGRLIDWVMAALKVAKLVG